MTLPVPSQRTWTVGDIVTAAEMNANVRDAVGFLAAPPTFVGRQSAAQNVASATSTPVAFDATTLDPYGGHSNTVNNSNYSAQVAGWYEALYDVAFPSNATGAREAILLVNGSTSSPAYRSIVGTAGGVAELQVGGMVYLNAGDYISVSAYQLSGATLTLTGASANVRWVHS